MGNFALCARLFIDAVLTFAVTAGNSGDVAANSPGTRSVSRVCRVTAYCDSGVTASGKWTRVGHCAAPADIPLGSTVYIPALNRSFEVTDRTAKRFRHNTVDIYMPSRGACVNFGRKYLRCEFTIEEAGNRGARLSR